MLAERPPLYFLAFMALFVIALALVAAAMHGAAAVRTPGFVLALAVGAALAIGETACAFLLTRIAARSPAGGTSPAAAADVARKLRLAAVALLTVAPILGAALGVVLPAFQRLAG